MGWDGAGNYNRQRNFSADASAGIKILASAMDQEINDIASAFTLCWARDGQNAPTADMPLGGNRLVNGGQPASATDYIRVKEVIENVPIYMIDTASSADRVSVSSQFFTGVSVAQAPADGTRILVKSLSHKSAPVLYLDGFSANIVHPGGNRVINAMSSGGIYGLVYNSSETSWHIENPSLGRTAAETAAGVTPTNYQYEPGNVLRYGAVADDSTDNTTAFQNAIDSVQGANGVMYIPSGTYRLSGPLAITGSIKVIGDGPLRTFLRKTTTTGDLFGIDTDDACIFRDFNVTSTSTPTAGSYFDLDAGSAGTVNLYSRFENLRLGTYFTAINTVDAAGWTVKDCYIVDGANVGIFVRNTVSVDNGDSSIINNIFDSSDTTATYAIRQFSSGGLRIIGNKFLRHEYQYSGEFSTGITTSILLISGNSFENVATTNIRIEDNAGGDFSNIVITGNQITANGTTYGISIANNPNVVIGNNQITVGSGAVAGISLQSVDNFVISPNVFTGNSSGVGISIDSGSSNGRVAIQQFKGLTTNISNASESTHVDRKQITATTTWDPAVIADGATARTSVSVSGAALGDPSIATLTSLGSANVLINSNVKNTNVVRVILLNHAGVSVDLGNGTLRATVFSSQ